MRRLVDNGPLSDHDARRRSDDPPGRPGPQVEWLPIRDTLRFDVGSCYYQRGSPSNDRLVVSDFA